MVLENSLLEMGEFCDDGHEDARPDQKDQGGNAPNDAVDRVIDLCQTAYKVFHREKHTVLFEIVSGKQRTCRSRLPSQTDKRSPEMGRKLPLSFRLRD